MHLLPAFLTWTQSKTLHAHGLCLCDSVCVCCLPLRRPHYLSKLPLYPASCPPPSPCLCPPPPSSSSSSSLPLPDVWNVYSHMECVCKSHRNQISLIPGGLNKVAFVCLCACVRVSECVVSPCVRSISRVQSCVL